MATGNLPPEVAALDAMAEDAPSGEGAPLPPHTQQGVLPSRGFRYGGAHAGGAFFMRMMTTEDEELLAGANKHTDANALIDELLRRCWVRPEIPFEELLLADKFYMLFFLRRISLEEKYAFKVTCGECGFKWEHELMLPDDLEKRELEESDKEPFFVELPVSATRVGLRLLRVKDENRVRKAADRMYRNTTKQGDPTYTLRLAAHVVSVDNEEVDPPTARAFIRTLVSKDSAKLRNAIDANDIGINLRVTTECPRCGEEAANTVKFNESFFRPRD